MGRRVVTIGKNTHAKGETFAIEKDREGRYAIIISLESLKTLKTYDLGHEGEFYFKIKREGHDRRAPDRGEILLMENQVFSARQDFTLWTEFIKLEHGDEKAIEVEIGLFERDPLVDKKIFERKIPVKLGAQTDYSILEDDKKQTKAKIKVSALRTRF